jgi:hypothetical protein
LCECHFRIQLRDFFMSVIAAPREHVFENCKKPARNDTISEIAGAVKSGDYFVCSGRRLRFAEQVLLTSHTNHPRTCLFYVLTRARIINRKTACTA